MLGRTSTATARSEPAAAEGAEAGAAAEEAAEGGADGEGEGGEGPLAANGALAAGSSGPAQLEGRFSPAESEELLQLIFGALQVRGGSGRVGRRVGGFEAVLLRGGLGK